MTDIFSQQRRNTRVTFALMLGFFLLIILVGLGVDIYTIGGLDLARVPYSTLVALALASVNGIVAYYFGSSVVLRSLGATELSFEDPSHKKLRNVVTEMCLATGLPMPRVYVIPDVSPNAFATGRSPKEASVVVTQGLIDTVTREELQAVVAHELAHIKSYDILTMTVAAVLVGTVSLLSDWALRSWRYGGIRPRRNLRGRGAIHPLLLFLVGVFVLLSPLFSRILAMAVSRNREYQADALSAEFTRNPLALASALEKISGYDWPLKSATRGSAHLFISDPLKRRLDAKEGFVADLFATHPPVEERIARLKKMGYISGAKAGV